MVDDASTPFWSDELGRALLRSMDPQRLADLHAVSTGFGAGEPAAARLTPDLLELARKNARFRAQIMESWRSAHADVVEAAALVSVESSREQCEALLAQFDAEDVLLELITDTRGAGWELAEWVVGSLPSAEVRSSLARRLQELASTSTPAHLPTERPLRIVIFGGHPRDESKLARRLFAGSEFEVRWKPCEKHFSAPDDRSLSEAMAHADGVILVTNMISHNVMHLVKRYVQQHEIPWRAVTKATDLQLTRALRELFPERVP